LVARELLFRLVAQLCLRWIGRPTSGAAAVSKQHADSDQQGNEAECGD